MERNLLRTYKRDLHLQFSVKREIFLEIPFSDLKLTRCEADGRDVYLYTGDLALDNFQWKAGKNTEWTYEDVLVMGVAGVAAIGLGAILGKLVYNYCTKKSDDKDPQKEKKSNKL